MSYAQFGTIAATDYNGLASTNTANVAYVYGTGRGQWGYGQSTSLLASVTGGSTQTITAAQWAGLFFLLNRCLGHQSGAGAQLGSGGNINAVTGSTITYLSNVATAVTTIGTNRLQFTSQGSTTTGSTLTSTLSASAGVAYGPSVFQLRTVTFASADQARYFFNAGGQINWVFTGGTNTGATARGLDVLNVFQTYHGGGNIRHVVGTGVTGSGGTVTTNNTTLGYYNLTTSPQLVANVTSTTSAYTTDWGNVSLFTNGTQGTNGDNGSVITLALGYYSPAHSGFNDSINVSLGIRIDVVFPETTYLTSVVTLPTIA